MFSPNAYIVFKFFYLCLEFSQLLFYCSERTLTKVSYKRKHLIGSCFRSKFMSLWWRYGSSKASQQA